MTVLITILVYSAILTAVAVYKDESSYCFSPEPIDIIAAGPCAWILVLVLAAIDLIGRRFLKNKVRPQKKMKQYSEKTAEKIIAKIIKWYKKNYAKKKREFSDMFLMQSYVYDGDGDGLSDWQDLIVKKPSHERVNHKFEHLIYNQEKLVEKILREKYMERFTIEDYEKEDVSEWWIRKYKDTEIWKVI